MIHGSITIRLHDEPYSIESKENYERKITLPQFYAHNTEDEADRIGREVADAIRKVAPSLG